MKRLPQLFENNRVWVRKLESQNPGFFKTLAQQQAPDFLWIGCSDSRVPANDIVGLLPGELFVHRNVANLVVHSDMNCLAVIQYAIEQLKVEHIIVCGHYSCGGVQAAMESQSHGLIDNWLRHIRDIYQVHRADLELLPDQRAVCDRLCELNVIHQVSNVCGTTFVQDAWTKGQPVSVHGWIYRVEDGLLKDLDVCISTHDELARFMDTRYRGQR